MSNAANSRSLRQANKAFAPSHADLLQAGGTSATDAWEEIAVMIGRSPGEARQLAKKRVVDQSLAWP